MTDTEHNGPCERSHIKDQSHSGEQPSLCTLHIIKKNVVV